MCFKKTFTPCLILCLLASAKMVFPADSLLVRKSVRIVKIGPQELQEKDIVDSVVLRKLQFEEYLLEANVRLANIKSYKNKAYLLSLIPDSLLTLGDKNAADSLEQALDSSVGADPKSQMSRLNALASYFARNGYISKSIEYFKKELALAEALKDRNCAAQISEKLAGLYHVSGRFDLAISALEYNINVNLNTNNAVRLASSYLSLANNKLMQYKYKEAEYCLLNKALPLFRKTGNKIGRMRSFQTLGDLYMDQSRLSEAKWFYLQAKLMAEKLSDNEARVSCLISLAEVKNALGDVQAAIFELKSAELLARKNNNLLALVTIKGNLGEIYHKAGDYPSAGYAIDEYNRLKTGLRGLAQL